MRRSNAAVLDSPRDVLLDARARVDEAVENVVDSLCDGAPPRLAAALRHAVLTPGGRRRPLLCMAVAQSIGEDNPLLSAHAAAAIELIHCASLVHDDLPCFDDAETRRGRPSVHKAFGEALAVLVGDALITGAFQLIAETPGDPRRTVQLVSLLARAAGSPAGMVAGQGWESEPEPDLERYHRGKTASLFEAAVMMGAASVGAAPEPWREVGTRIGMAYQILDDARDLWGDPEAIGKPVGRDVDLQRPSAIWTMGAQQAMAAYAEHRDFAVSSIPECPGRDLLAGLVFDMLEGLRPGFPRAARERT